MGNNIWGIVITGGLAVLGMTVSSTLNGLWDIELKKKEFQSQLIMQALESSEAKERQAWLQFLIDTNLIEDQQIREGLIKYSIKGTKKLTPPQLKTKN
ncbi:MAG: hypothetical protein AAF383_30345 [Cyanobacteria bacterium P01_A01_bin.83]